MERLSCDIVNWNGLPCMRNCTSGKSAEEAQLWMRAFVDWHAKHKEYINERRVDDVSGRWWYTHKMLHRSTSHIMRAIPNMFSYTRYHNVSKTSNSIESFFGHLKDHLRLHRGLSNDHFKDFVKWYLFLQSNQGKAPHHLDLKKCHFLHHYPNKSIIQARIDSDTALLRRIVKDLDSSGVIYSVGKLLNATSSRNVMYWFGLYEKSYPIIANANRLN